MTAETPSHPLFAAVYDPVMRNAEAELFPPHREYLARELSGRVLDIGSGTGAMFPYFAAAETDVEIHAIEPDPHMRKRAVERAGNLGLAVEFSSDAAESLSYPDDYFDVVTAGIVFCTIPDPAAALDEVAHVLRSGGEFRFFEHVHDSGWRSRVQSIVEPAWERLAAGCQLTRETDVRFTSHPEFDVTDLDRYEVGITPVRPFVRGTLRRK